MKDRIKSVLDNATANALATTGPHGLNVVPVSVVEMKEDEIHLYDFFMNKTAENLQIEPIVALTSWSGFIGFQIKAEAIYEVEGAVFEEAVVNMKNRFPERTLKAVIRLKPIAVYDIAPTSGGENLLS